MLTFVLTFQDFFPENTLEPGWVENILEEQEMKQKRKKERGLSTNTYSVRIPSKTPYVENMDKQDKQRKRGKYSVRKDTFCIIF